MFLNSWRNRFQVPLALINLKAKKSWLWKMLPFDKKNDKQFWLIVYFWTKHGRVMPHFKTLLAQRRWLRVRSVGCAQQRGTFFSFELSQCFFSSHSQFRLESVGPRRYLLAIQLLPLPLLDELLQLKVNLLRLWLQLRRLGDQRQLRDVSS